MKPGIYDYDNQEYHDGPGVSSSVLKKVLRSPAHSQIRTQSTAAMQLGTALHDMFETTDWGYAVRPAGLKLSTKAGKEWKAAQDPEDTIIGHEDAEKVHGMHAALTANAQIASLLDSDIALHERSHYSIDDVTGLLIKVRPDLERPDLRLILDWKTTEDARAHAIRRDAIKYGWHLSASMYLDFARGEYDYFVWAVVEKSAPHGVGMYTMTRGDEAYEYGRRQYSRALQIYAQCKESGRWPGYDAEPLEIGVPRWALEEEST